MDRIGERQPANLLRDAEDQVITKSAPILTSMR